MPLNSSNQNNNTSHDDRIRLAAALMANTAQSQLFASMNPHQAVNLYFSRPTNINAWSMGHDEPIAAAGPSNVTLHNHSQNSGFTRVTPTSSAHGTGFAHEPSLAQHIPRVVLTPIISRSGGGDQHHQQQAQQPTASNEAASVDAIPELDSTHFKPIKFTYFDGHTFDIPSQLNAVDYRRSPGGSQYLDQDKYSRHVPCADLANDDLTGDSERQAQMPEPHSDRDHRTAAGDAAKKPQTDFVVMFCVKQSNEMACQTMDEAEVTDMLVEMEMDAIRDRRTMEPSCSMEVEVQHDQIVVGPHDKEVVVHQQYDKEMEVHQHDEQHPVEQEEQQLVAAETAGEQPLFVDAAATQAMTEWYKLTATDKCGVMDVAHRMWEVCQFCGESPASVVSAMPVDRQLVDELSAEGDEIMSDLQNLQSLDIGSWEQESEDDEDEEEAWLNDSAETEDAQELREEEEDAKKDAEAAASPVDIFYNVNMLITDRLRPERARRFGEAAAVRRNAATDRFIGGLWNNAENFVWRREMSPDEGNGGCGTDSMSSIFSSVSTTAATTGADSQSTSGLGGSVATAGSGWEHSNLVQIWNPIEANQQQRHQSSGATSPSEASSSTTTETSMTTSPSGSSSALDVESVDDPVSSSVESKRGERKRRYSASNMPDETRDTVADLMRDYAIRKPNSLYGDEPPMTTIITCNFWTTSAAIDDADQAEVSFSRSPYQPSGHVSDGATHVELDDDDASASEIHCDTTARSVRPLTR